MGNTCKSMADSYWCVTETTTVLWSGWPPTNKNKWKKKLKKTEFSLVNFEDLIGFLQ